MIRRFNQHSTMVLRACNLTESSASSCATETSGGDSVRESSKQHENERKSKSQLNGNLSAFHINSKQPVYSEEPIRKKVSAHFSINSRYIIKNVACNVAVIINQLCTM